MVTSGSELARGLLIRYFHRVPETIPSIVPSKSGAILAPASPKASPQSGMVLSTLKYLLRTEVHTFAFSVAANAILAFFPFVVLLMTLIRRVFHSKTMYEVVKQLLLDYLPAGQDFVFRNRSEERRVGKECRYRW